MDRVEFTVNGQQCSVGSEVTSDVTLLDYLRNTLELRGTKYMCREGGCGACIVLAERGTGGDLQTVNSCLVSVTSCKEWSITTTEHVGNKLKGYNVVQKSLADHNGSQCGYCSPAWVMSMIGLMKGKNTNLTPLELEKSFASNICRCTGYRPILSAFKSLLKDPKTLVDIEDLHKNLCKNTGKKCKKDSCSNSNWCFVDSDGIEDDPDIHIKLKDNKHWFKVYNQFEVFKILKKYKNKSYMLVNGNTGKGAYPIVEYPDILIDISDVQSLKHYIMDQNLILGAGNTLTETIEIFAKVAQNEDGFSYLNTVNEHLELVAHIAVRNIGTVGGNLMLKYQHNEFPSDLFLLFETIGAMVTIVDGEGKTTQVTLKTFLSINMTDKIIVNIELPPLSVHNQLVSFKIMPRAQNAISIVNAGFLYKFNTNQTVVTKASIVFGNISPDFIHAVKTEAYLNGKDLFTNETLQNALKILNQELIVTEGYNEEIKKAKKKVALGLFYKGLLSLCPKNLLDSHFYSGTTSFHKIRAESEGQQKFDTNKSLWPLNKPIPKLEALIQCSGEAPYVEDAPTMPREVFAAFVTSTVATGQIVSIDASPALNLKSVIAFYTVKDLPGLNSFTPTNTSHTLANEEQLCDGNVKFFNQPIGIIVAETRVLANRAADLVNIEYQNVNKPVLDIVTATKYPERVKLSTSFAATAKGENTKYVVKGSNNIYSQYHFHMETQLCITKPTDDGIEVLSSSQWLDQVQIAISQCLNINENALNLSVRRIGGAFGAKVSRSTQIAIACTLVTLRLNRPCRMILPLTTNMRSIGKRLPASSNFEAGVDGHGKIQYLKYNIYLDNGYMLNEPFYMLGSEAVGNSYDKSRWDFNDYDTTTDTAKNSWMRAPGTLDHIAMTEHIMEQICYELSLDPVEMRKQNLVVNQSMRDIIDSLVVDGDYHKRLKEVEKYNTENRWKKRGLRFVPLMWPIAVGAYFNVAVAIYHGDGTVAVTHGGVEMGQGINTKAAQVCAYKLEIPLEIVKVKSTNNFVNANGNGTVGSFCSEMVCLGVTKSCEILLDRLAPYRKDGDQKWADLIAAAFSDDVDLFASYNATKKDQTQYNVYGATLVEAEIDVLTGESEILRVDLMEDVGQSLSPEVDIGQIEGAFTMGQGYWTCEDLQYDQNTGELLTDRTWNYHVPQARDIPVKMNVYFVRNSYNPVGVLGSKATGEPATCMAVCVPFAIRHAIVASRSDSGLSPTTWFNIDGAYIVEKIINALQTELEEFLFKKL